MQWLRKKALMCSCNLETGHVCHFGGDCNRFQRCYQASWNLALEQLFVLESCREYPVQVIQFPSCE